MELRAPFMLFGQSNRQFYVITAQKITQKDFLTCYYLLTMANSSVGVETTRKIHGDNLLLANNLDEVFRAEEWSLSLS